jgi:hypothetical protein
VSKHPKFADARRRAKIQAHFWNEVGAAEHISLPRLKDAIRKEFNINDERLVQRQVDLMRTEQRIMIESRVKIWIKQPQNSSIEPSLQF